MISFSLRRRPPPFTATFLLHRPGWGRYSSTIAAIEDMAATKVYDDVVRAVQKLTVSSDGGEERAAENVFCTLYEALYKKVVKHHGNGDKIRGFHMRLLNGTVMVYEIPNQIHEMITRKLEDCKSIDRHINADLLYVSQHGRPP